MCLIYFCVLSFQLKEEILNDYAVILGEPRRRKKTKQNQPGAGSHSVEWAEFPIKFLVF